MVSEVTACMSRGHWLYCALTAPQRVFSDVQGIASEVRTFYLQVWSLIPRIVTGISNCLYETSADYQQVLDGIVAVAEKCMFDFDH